MSVEPITTAATGGSNDRWARSAFLAEATALLDASLDYEVTLQNVARLAVPFLADWCVVDLCEGDEIRRMAVAHADPEKEAVAWDYTRRYPTRASDPRGVAEVIRSGQTQLVPEIPDGMIAASARDADHLSILRELGLVSAMVIPLRARNQVLGAMTLISAESDRRYSPESVVLAEELASRCAVAIDNSLLYRNACEAENRMAESLALLDTLFASAPVGLAFFDSDLRFLRANGTLAAIDGVPREEHIGRPIGEVLPAMGPAVDGLRRVLETGEPLLDQEICGETPAAPGEERHWLASFYPVRDDQGQTHGLGAVVTDITERKHAEQERAELLSQLASMARTDALTGLPNRRVWQEEIPRAMARAEREEEPLCVALLDLDHFKAYNDGHGHVEGDRFLAETARAWGGHLREVDLLVRFGGEEFAVILPGCDASEARTVIERVRAVTPAGETCSAGIAEWDGHESPGTLYARADAALYAAKGAGRDRTELAGARAAA